MVPSRESHLEAEAGAAGRDAAPVDRIGEAADLEGRGGEREHEVELDDQGEPPRERPGERGAGEHAEPRAPVGELAGEGVAVAGPARAAGLEAEARREFDRAEPRDGAAAQLGREHADAGGDVEVVAGGGRARGDPHGGEVEAKERKSIVTKLDQLSDDWVRLRTSTCRDHFDRKMIDAETYRKRVKCFDDRLDEQRRIVAAARASDLATAQKLAETASGISNACK